MAKQQPPDEGAPKKKAKKPRNKVKAAGAGQMPRATHKGSFKKEFGFDVDCDVLDDEQKTAVISQRGMGEALGLDAAPAL
ncbi:MAG TPA: hypothetical protein VF815_09045 [Myxococcaceae bacterium]|jgi:hypothetical protein